MVLEHVKGLCNNKTSPFAQGIRQSLQLLDYEVVLGVLNAANYLVPQVRQRLFVVAIRKDSLRRQLKWPKQLGNVTLSSVLDAPTSSGMAGRLPTKTAG